MANKALGRDLGDLLSRAQPARLLDRAAAKSNSRLAPAASASDGAGPHHGTPLTAASEPGPRPAETLLESRNAVGPRRAGLALTSGSLGFFLLDLIFLAAAVFAIRSGWFTFAVGGSLAVMAGLLGAVCGCLGVLSMAAGSLFGDRQGGSKIRVQLKQ